MTISQTIDPPLVTDSTATFNSKAFAAWAALNTWASQANALAGDVDADASTATTQAGIATTQAGNASTSAGTATTQAGIATAAAANLASLNALWLGAQASDPATGTGGAALVAGNAYVNTASGYLRAYNGTAWVQGVSAVSGVSTFNGLSGAITGVSSVNGASGAVTVSGAPDFLLHSQGII